jgi:5-methylcytosine-specific restriction endonuclease McrA
VTRPSACRRGYDRAWRRLRAAVLGEWIALHGWLCPGFGRWRHRTTDLTVDHVVPLRLGGARLERANLQVLCAGCNTAKARVQAGEVAA